MTRDDDYVFMGLFCQPCISYGAMSIQNFCPFLNWNVWGVLFSLVGLDFELRALSLQSWHSTA
jgi:hypothetical protein